MIRILKASAGSGKTYNLGKEYIRLLMESDRPDAYRHVLAVTFTNKATDEMKRRILKELHTLSQEPRRSPYLEDLQQALHKDVPYLQKRAQQQLSGILHDYSAFAVSTIDRFFQQTLRSFSREIGQFASYQVQLDREALVAESVDRVLDNLSEEGDGQLLRWLTDSVQEDLRQRGWFSLEGKLQEMAMSLRELPEGEVIPREKLGRLRKQCRQVQQAFEARVEAAARACLEALQSAGMAPGSLHWGRMPVVLHPFYPYSDGSVAWAPKVMDLYTHPEPYGSQPQSWMTQLTVHESRHVAQMQLAYRRPFRWANYLVGEMWPGAITALFTPPVFLEGDAVVAETALTASGRGRSADFLNYYHLAFDNGDWRDWYKWIYGSFKKAGPDYYTVGYMTVAGMRYFYDQPSFTADYFDHVSKHPFPVAALQRYIRRISGKKFKQAFREIQEGFHDIWTEEADARGPFMEMEQVTR